MFWSILVLRILASTCSNVGMGVMVRSSCSRCLYTLIARVHARPHVECIASINPKISVYVWLVHHAPRKSDVWICYSNLLTNTWSHSFNIGLIQIVFSVNTDRMRRLFRGNCGYLRNDAWWHNVQVRSCFSLKQSSGLLTGSLVVHDMMRNFKH